MSELTLATIESDFVHVSKDTYQIEEREDVFIGIFNLICLNESFFNTTNFYSILKWLDSNLSIQLSTLNSINCYDLSKPENKKQLDDTIEKLTILRASFISKIQEINIENIDDSILFVYYHKIQDYFKSINSSDLDFKYHNEEKFKPTINTSGYLSGLQKDWINRMQIIEKLYNNAELNHEKKKRKKPSWYLSLMSLTGGNSKKVSAIEGKSMKALEYDRNAEIKFNEIKEPEPIQDQNESEIFFWNKPFKYFSSSQILKQFTSGLIISMVFYGIYNIPKKIIHNNNF